MKIKLLITSVLLVTLGFFYACQKDKNELPNARIQEQPDVLPENQALLDDLFGGGFYK